MCQDTLGFSPTRGLDKYHMDISKVGSIVACLNFDNEPKKAFASRKAFKILQHSYFSFIGNMSLKMIIEINQSTELQVQYTEGENGYLVLLSGTALVWRVACVDMSDPDMMKAIRTIFNKCHLHLERAGFAEIWSGYSKRELPDGTYTMEL